MVRSGFDIGPDGWCSYDYHASVITGDNVFILTSWQATGGVDNGGYAWTDNTRWSADTPEKPLSILPLLRYRSWVAEDAVDLADAELSVYLRGDGLQLDGAACYFWIHGAHTRWHLTGQPLTVADGSWSAEPNRVTLPDDESQWHRSWSLDPATPAPLSSLLKQQQSYGFSFVGFSREVSGRLSIDEFEIVRR